MDIYILGPKLDLPNIKCFSIADTSPMRNGPSLWKEFYPNDSDVRKIRPWKMEPFGLSWKPRRLINPKPEQINDYPAIGGSIPVFSRRAVEVLGEFLEPNGELLPLVPDENGEVFYAYNTLTVLDALDLSRSKVEWHPTDRLRMKKGEQVNLITAYAVHCYEFIPERVNRNSIFRLVEMPYQIYVSDLFAKRVIDGNLIGFDLNLVWSSCKGTAS